MLHKTAKVGLQVDRNVDLQGDKVAFWLQKMPRCT